MASYVFTIPGNYSYDCSVGSHVNGMVGTIQVNPTSSSTCIVDQYRIRYRPLGASSWFMKTMGAPVGSCNNPAVNTSKLLLNLNPSTTYEYQMKAGIVEVVVLYGVQFITLQLHQIVIM